MLCLKSIKEEAEKISESNKECLYINDFHQKREKLHIFPEKIQKNEGFDISDAQVSLLSESTVRVLRKRTGATGERNKCERFLDFVFLPEFRKQTNPNADFFS